MLVVAFNAVTAVVVVVVVENRGGGSGTWEREVER